MAAVEMKDKKKEMIEKTAQEFQKLNGDNQMFILGYMLGIQQERQRTTDGIGGGRNGSARNIQCPALL